MTDDRALGMPPQPGMCSEASEMDNAPLLECYLSGKCVVRVQFATPRLKITTFSQGGLSTAVDRIVSYGAGTGG